VERVPLDHRPHKQLAREGQVKQSPFLQHTHPQLTQILPDRVRQKETHQSAERHKPRLVIVSQLAILSTLLPQIQHLQPNNQAESVHVRPGLCVLGEAL